MSFSRVDQSFNREKKKKKASDFFQDKGSSMGRIGLESGAGLGLGLV